MRETLRELDAGEALLEALRPFVAELAADPPSITSAVPNWRPGDTIPLGGRSLRMLRIRDDDADQPPVLIVEDAA